MTTLTDPPLPEPVRTMSQTDFDAAWAARLAWERTHTTEMQAFNASLTTLAAGGFAIPYLIDLSGTTDVDPGNGKIRFDNATQNIVTTLRVDLIDSSGNTRTPTLDTFDDSTNTIKGQIMLESETSPSKFLLFNVTSLAAPSGYRNVTVAPVDFSATNPFTNGEAVVLKFTRAGDAGATGPTGPISFPVAASVGGTADAITATFSPVTSLVDKNYYSWNPTGANTVVNPTANFDGTGVRTIKARGGQPLRIGDIPGLGASPIVQYRASGTYYELLNPQGREMAGYSAPGAGSITLTSASARDIKAVPTAYDSSWTMPDARTMQIGEEQIEENASAFPMPIFDNSSSLIGWVAPWATVRARCRDNSTATGAWKVITGERDRDAGLHWWGALMSQSISGVTVSNILVCQLSTQYGFYGYYNGTDYIVWGYSLAEDRLSVSNSSITLISGANLATTACIDACRLSATQGMVHYYSGVNSVVSTIDINTTTLALTLGANATTDATPTTPGGFSCDAISSSLALVTYGSSTYIKTRTVSVSGSTCTPNTASTVASASCKKSSVKVLSTTLAHVQYDDGSNNLKVNRIVLSGTGVAPGTPVAVTSRLASQGTNDQAFDLGKVSATASWTICVDGSNVAYGEVYTDNGSTISPTETALLTGPTNNSGNQKIDRPGVFTVSDYSGCGLLMSYDTEQVTMRKASVSGTAVKLSPVLQLPPNVSGIPQYSATQQIMQQAGQRIKVYNGIGMYPFVKTTTPRIVFQPFAVN